MVGTPRIAPGVSWAMKIAIAVASVVVLVSSCTGAKESSSPATPAGSSSGTAPSVTPSDQAVIDYASFTDGLEAAGFTVRSGGRTRGLPLSLLAVPGQRVSIDGVSVSVFEYPTEKALLKVRSAIRPRGDEIPTADGGTAIIDWDPPHFYGAGKLLVLYFGDKQPTIDALNLLLGPQFAGGPQTGE